MLLRWIAAGLGLVAVTFAARAVLARWQDRSLPPPHPGTADQPSLQVADQPRLAPPAPVRRDDVRDIPF